MPEDSVTFTIDIEESVDPKKLEAMIDAAVERRLAGAGPEREGVPAPETPEKTPPPAREIPAEKAAASPERGLISEYGYGHEPRKHYPVKRRPRRRLPETGQAPFSADSGAIPGFGGSAYVAPRGFQQEKVSRRGKTRYAGAGPAFPGVESFLDRMQRIERDVAGNRRTGTDLAAGISRNRARISRAAAAVASPQGAAGEQVLSLLTRGGPYGAAIAAAIGAIVAAPEVAKQLIQTLSQKGLPLNRDWHRSIEDEVNALFDVEEKKRRLIGLDSFVVTQQNAYRPSDGATSHSLENRDEIIISKIGQAEKAVGVVYP